MEPDFSNLTLQGRVEHLARRGVFLGGPLRKFETVGRNQLSILLRSGLNIDSNVLDVGCGCLRAGYWLIHFLSPGSYFGIEPNEEMLDAGKEILITQPVLQAKRPRFDTNDAFDFGIFDARFDFVLARSIWTHASPAQIEKMLDEFLVVTPSTGTFLTSIKPARWYQRQYRGSKWVGRSAVSEEGGIVRYRISWIRRVCRDRALTVETLQEEHGQTWLRIRKLPESGT